MAFQSQPSYIDWSHRYLQGLALGVIYNPLSRNEKTEWCKTNGIDSSQVKHYIYGRRPISPKYLLLLFNATNNRVFLLTDAERKTYSRSVANSFNRLLPPELPILSDEEFATMTAGVVVPEHFMQGIAVPTKPTQPIDPLPPPVREPETETVGLLEEKNVGAPGASDHFAISAYNGMLTMLLGLLRTIISTIAADQGLWKESVQAEEFQNLVRRLVGLAEIQIEPVTTTHDQELIIVSLPIRQLVAQINELSNQLYRVSRLPAGDSDREFARCELVNPSMKLFNAVRVLALQYPESFVEFLQQLDIASHVKG